jgi:hypothetical protein
MEAALSTTIKKMDSKQTLHSTLQVSCN